MDMSLVSNLLPNYSNDPANFANGALIIGKHSDNYFSILLFTNSNMYHCTTNKTSLLATAGSYKRFVFDSDLTSYALKSELPDLSEYITKSVADSSYMLLNPD
jgi:hypothetical protein